MFEFTTNQAHWQEDSGGVWLRMRVKNREVALKACEAIEGKLNRVEVVEHKTKRTLDANAYYWTLVGQLAAKTNIPKTSIYRHMIKEIGDNCVTVPIMNSALDRFRDNWESNGLGWVTDSLGDSKIANYTNIVAYYGSSTYDVKQMSRLIELAVQECEQLGIPTMTKKELEKICDEWGK